MLCSFSGRISGDVASKAAKVGLPIVASLSAALSSGITIAEESNVTIAGFVRETPKRLYFP